MSLLVVTDLSTRGGTFVNGLLLPQSKVLQSYDEVMVGGIIIEVAELDDISIMSPDDFINPPV